MSTDHRNGTTDMRVVPSSHYIKIYYINIYIKAAGPGGT